VLDTSVFDGPAFDAAIVDVPCSNTGVIARRPEARLSLKSPKLAALAPLQRELLERAAATVRPGGRLIYSTCSIEPEENEAVLAAFLQTHPEWRAGEQHTQLPRWGPRLADWRDGGFAAVQFKAQR
jgi:16S rRNA (cytosine967-C5)-methyltransferase